MRRKHDRAPKQEAYYMDQIKQLNEDTEKDISKLRENAEMEIQKLVEKTDKDIYQMRQPGAMSGS